MKLNIGCGEDIKEGYVNIDNRNLKGVDVILDLNEKLPFHNNYAEEVLAQDVMEHLDTIGLLKEIHRILIQGGQVIIRVPHYSSRHNHIDPTHKKQFSVLTFYNFVKVTNLKHKYYDWSFSKINVRLDFEKGLLLHNYLIEWIVNIHPMMLNLFEATGLHNLFPAQNINVRLIK